MSGKAVSRRLRVHFRPGPEIFSQNHAHIHSPKGVGFHHYQSLSQGPDDVSGAFQVAPTGHHQGGIHQRIRIAQEHHVEPLPAKRAGGSTGSPLAPGAIQHFDRDAPLRRLNRRRRTCLLLRFGPEKEPTTGCKEYSGSA